MRVWMEGDKGAGDGGALLYTPRSEARRPNARGERANGHEEGVSDASADDTRRGAGNVKKDRLY